MYTKSHLVHAGWLFAFCLGFLDIDDADGHRFFERAFASLKIFATDSTDCHRFKRGLRFARLFCHRLHKFSQIFMCLRFA